MIQKGSERRSERQAKPEGGTKKKNTDLFYENAQKWNTKYTEGTKERQQRMKQGDSNEK